MWKDCTMIKKIKETDWWEVSYLIIYGIIFSKEFLQTTMFPIPWPLGLGYVFALMSGGYVIAKFLFHNTYTKKEMILAVLVLIAFCVPALTTDYTYLFWTGCLIVGAKDVDFNKILKVYLVLSITFMVTAFAASQGGLIEDLVYIAIRRGENYWRHSYGIIYPTDYAAHLFYIVLAMGILCVNYMTTMVKVWMCLLVALSVYLTSNAQTSMLCLIIFAGFCVFEKLFRKKMPVLGKMLSWTVVICAVFFISLSFFYNPLNEWMLKFDEILKNRVKLSNQAIDLYDIKLFGQNIVEVGAGLEVGWKGEYFFLDDSYIRVLLEYGVITLVVVLAMMVIISRKSCQKERYDMLFTIVVIAIHSLIEHRLVDIAYNPIILALFVNLSRRKGMTGGKHV